MTKADRYRVVQWATGNIGSHSLRAVIEHPDLDLVGLYVYSEDKAGRDAGELCGVAPTGVLATRDVGEILALQPDCVLYMADRVDVDVLCRLLEAGANVVSTRSEFHNPARLDPETPARIEAACAQGGSSLHSTGSSPGFITEALPLVLTSLQRRLDHLLIEEFADMSSRNSPELIFDLMGFGPRPADLRPERRRGPRRCVVRRLARGRSPRRCRSRSTRSRPPGQVATARHDVDVAAGHVRGRHDRRAAHAGHAACGTGGRCVTFSANWYLTTDVEPAWDLRETGWHVLVEGDTPLDIDIRFPVPPDEWAATSPGLTAHRPVNAIPYVCAAEPGIRTIVDLPQVVATLGLMRRSMSTVGLVVGNPKAQSRTLALAEAGRRRRRRRGGLDGADTADGGPGRNRPAAVRLVLARRRGGRRRDLLLRTGRGGVAHLQGELHGPPEVLSRLVQHHRSAGRHRRSGHDRRRRPPRARRRGPPPARPGRARCDFPCGGST